MNGGNINNSSSEDEQRLVMLGKTTQNILIHYISKMPTNRKQMLKVSLTKRVSTTISAGDGKTDSDDETCRTFIFRYDVIPHNSL